MGKATEHEKSGNQMGEVWEPYLESNLGLSWELVLVPVSVALLVMEY